MCMPEGVDVHHMRAGAHRGPKTEANLLELGCSRQFSSWRCVGNVGTWWGCWKWNLGPLPAQQLLSTAESSLPIQPGFWILFLRQNHSLNPKLTRTWPIRPHWLACLSHPVLVFSHMSPCPALKYVFGTQTRVLTPAQQALHLMPFA